MADIALKQDSDNTVTSVPNTFIDKYMTHANGEFVKIYLYLLRCISYPDTPFSISATADKFEQPESDVKRALKYWEKLKLLRLEFDSQNEMTAIHLLDPKTAGAAASPDTDTVPQAASPQTASPQPTETVQAARRIPPKVAYTPDQISQFAKDINIQELFFVAESYMGHPLNTTEVQTILYWLEQIGFSEDLIEYLIESCVSSGHKSIYYMDKVALAWAEQGIQKPSDAKHSQDTHSSLARSVQHAFGISGRTLAEAETDCLKRWAKDYGFSDEIIACACERTIKRIHQVNFEYAGKILSNWHKHHVCTLKDIELLDAQYQESQKTNRLRSGAIRTATGTTVNRFNDIAQRSYDYDELERSLLAHQ